MRIISILFLLSFFLGCSQKNETPVVEEKTESASIAVNSMVCNMCVNTLTDALKKVEGVQTVAVNLDTKNAAVTFFPAKTAISMLENAITEVGYNANEKKRNEVAYEQLPGCCKTE
ncbi:MAG: heavy-metal-associated domain-containing protein [Ignavibacteriales bacterium]|nr:heavy-metal-associated domain-containing protein [Ignavibacteriales bacterium]